MSLIPLLELDGQGYVKGVYVLNTDAIIGMREETRHNSVGRFKCCRITTKELSVDDTAAAMYRATASYSDSVLVMGSLAQVYAWTLNPKAAVLDNLPGAFLAEKHEPTPDGAIDFNL